MTSESSDEVGPREGDDGGAWQIGDAEGGWWAVERAKVLNETIADVVPTHGLAVDLGCGRGQGVVQLSEIGARYVVGLDAQRDPQWEPKPGKYGFVVCDARQLPFRPGVADLVTMLDVIEHFKDDRAPLQTAGELLGPSGRLAVTVPALPRLWSKFDETVGHHRRYTRTALDASLRRAGFEPTRTTYFFSWLVPPMWLLRKRDRSNADRVSGGLLGRVASTATSLVGSVERLLLRRARVPIGTSLISVSKPIGAGVAHARDRERHNVGVS